MIKCPKCHSEACVKDGIVQGRQRYRCKDCGYRHTVKERGLGADKKRQALELYLEGLGFRSIGRFLRCSHVAVYNWIKSYGAAIEEIRSSAGVEVVEMDEMHTYVGSKKTIAGSGLLLIAMESASSTALWVPATPKQGKSYGKPSKTTRS
jgi:transposase-like protein